MASERVFLTQRELADLLAMKPNTLWSWRQRGYGPPWFRFGPRTVRYDRDEVEQWIAEQENRTS